MHLYIYKGKSVSVRNIYCRYLFLQLQRVCLCWKNLPSDEVTDRMSAVTLHSRFLRVPESPCRRQGHLLLSSQQINTCFLYDNLNDASLALNHVTQHYQRYIFFRLENTDQKLFECLCKVVPIIALDPDCACTFMKLLTRHQVYKHSIVSLSKL